MKAIQESLDLLAELQDSLGRIETRKAELIETAIPQDVKQRLAEIEAEYAGMIQTANAKIADTQAAIKDAVLQLGQTVKGTSLMAVWSKPRVT